jgi:hypothetical protein
VASWSGTVGEVVSLAAPTRTPIELRTAGAGFSEWIAALAIPLRTEPSRLEISSHESGFFLVESPEPLGPDVTVTVFGNSAQLPSVTLVDATASRMLVVCDAPITGDVRLEFRLDRSRFRAMLADSQSSLQSTASVSFQLAVPAPA